MPDLRVALQHEPLGLVERARLAQDLLRDGELAEIVKARGKTGELDLPVARPSRRAMRAASSLTRSEWLPVYASRASTAFARLAAAR